MTENLTLTQKMHAAAHMPQQHAWGSFPYERLERLEKILPVSVERSLETGCGKTSVIFSNIADQHTIFAYDDRDLGERSSVRLYESHPMTQRDRIQFVPGPTQQTLPNYAHEAQYDVIMLDGPHGSPFVELEYYFLYPHLKKGGFLILDDVHIPTIGQFADVLKEDEMFEYHALIETTLVLRRTHADTFDPLGDGWYRQNYNRRRVATELGSLAKHRLDDGMKLHPMSKIIAEKLRFESILAGNDAVKRVSPFSRIVDGFKYEIGGRQYSLSGRNIAKRLQRLGSRLRLPR